MKKEFFKKFMSLITFVLSTQIYAQTITGIVTSEDGPLPGAAVILKGTNQGTSTDFDGNWSVFWLWWETSP